MAKVKADAALIGTALVAAAKAILAVLEGEKVPDKPAAPDHGWTLIGAVPYCKGHGVEMRLLEGTSKKNGKPYAFYGCSDRDANGVFCGTKAWKQDVETALASAQVAEDEVPFGDD